MAITGNAVQVMDPYSEALAGFPLQPRKQVQTDGTEPGGTGARGPKQGVSPDAPIGQDEEQPQQRPTLADVGPDVQFRTIDQLVRSQDRLRKNRYAIDLYHTWLDGNVQFGRLDKVPNQNIWMAKLAPGVSVERSAAVPNKAADLCNKVVDTLLADPPKPNPQPHVDDESADAAAALTQQVLEEIRGEAGIREVEQYRWALRNSLTRSSSFLEFDVDADGGGYQPMQVLASGSAQNPNAPLTDAQGQTDPNPVLRYVGQGQFVQTPDQADKVWLPKLVCRRHQRVKVTLFPATASLEDAEAIVLADFCTIAEGIKRWPETVGQMSDAELAGLANWRPYMSEQIVPFTFKGGIAEGMTGPALSDVGTFSPLLQRRMFFYRLQIRKSQEYPQGLAIDISGQNGGTQFGMKTLDYTVPSPEGGQVERCTDLTFVQVTPNIDVADQDPMGWPFEARFDGSAQADATLVAGYLDALDRMAHPHVFIPSTTEVDEDEWFDRTVPIIIGPTSHPPTYESFPPLPPVVQVSEYLGTRQDVASGLTATAQGLDSANSASGIAKKLTVRQAQISLAGIQQNLHQAMTRGWRVQAQLIQQNFKTPQLIRLTGEQSSNEEQWWTGEDLAGIDDRIGIEPGTGTMMTAEDKANYVAFLQGQRWMTEDQAAEIGVTGISRDLGLPSDPVKSAIERAVAVWLKGPDAFQPGWTQLWQQYAQEKQQFDLATQQFQQAQQMYQQYVLLAAQVAGGAPPLTLGPELQNEKAMQDYQRAVIQLRALEMQNPQVGVPPQQPTGPDGQPLQPPQPPPTPFGSRPSDTQPEVAIKWEKRLRHLQFQPRYDAQPPEWRAACDLFYTTVRQALATATGAAPANPMAGVRRSEVKSPGAASPAVPGSAAQPNSQAMAA